MEDSERMATGMPLPDQQKSLSSILTRTRLGGSKLLLDPRSPVHGFPNVSRIGPRVASARVSCSWGDTATSSRPLPFDNLRAEFPLDFPSLNSEDTAYL